MSTSPRPSPSPSKARTQGWKRELHEAVWNGDAAKVNELIAAKANLEETELDMQPLNLAVIRDNTEIAKRLLDAGAKVDGGDTPALFTACALEKLEMVRLLLKYNASLTSEDKKQKIAAIHITADKGFLAIMNLLLEAKADANLRSSEGKMTPLHYAASCGRTDVVARLIKAGADVNAQNISDNTPLLMACNKGHTDTVRELLRAKADMTVHGKPDGLTALHAAVVFGGAEGFVDTARVLLENGAPINQKSVDGALTPLHCAAAKGHVGCVKLLLEKGADVHALDKFNSTPLRIAASNANTLENPAERFLQVAELLLKHGADLNASSAAGNTPLHSIAKLGDPELVRWMLQNGADSAKKNNEGLSSMDCAKTDEIRKLMENWKKGGAAGDYKSTNADSDDDDEGVYTKKNWVPDEHAPACTNCNNPFTFFNRRHHCRACGKVFCGKCSSNTQHLRGSKKALRVCDKCFAQAS